MLSYSQLYLALLLLFDKVYWTGLHQRATWPPAATFGLQESRVQTDDWWLKTAVGCPPTWWHLESTLCNWLNLFWLQDWNRPFLREYLWIYNFITPTHFWFNPHELLIPTHYCLPLYAGASCNHFVYTAGTSSSVKGQYATVIYLVT